MALFDTRPLFEAFQQRTSAVHEGARVVTLTLRSAHEEVLLPEDRGAAENIEFPVALFLPERGERFDALTLVLHGLNEGTEAKLFPWAASLAARGTPALILPSSFHVSRRPASFLAARGEAFEARRGVEGNGHSSPYNATISARFASHPDRLVRGNLQTYADIIELARGLARGDHPALSPFFSKGARTHFLAYSISGYLTQLALLANPEGLFSESRAVMFSTGAALFAVRPETILILDDDAQRQVHAYYDTEEGRSGRHPLLDELGVAEIERRVLTSFLYGGAPLQQALQACRDRILAIANRNDTVFPLDAVAETFAGLSVERMDLGLHELPFNHEEPLSETYSDREGRKLLLKVLRSYAVGEAFQERFTRFIDACDAHLRAPTA